MNNKEIVELLFSSQAFKVAQADQPFWYTSGKFGPYFINTHFLYENEEVASDFLQRIDYSLDHPLTLARIIGLDCWKQYNSYDPYKQVIDHLSQKATDLEFDYISGGARRDFFFSYALAELMGKDHLSILKDGSVYLSTKNFKSTHELKSNELSGKKVLHVADLVTEASSYIRAWLPAIEDIGAEITDTLVVVDRQQGGSENLKSYGVDLISLLSIEPEFFAIAREIGQINGAQEKALESFFLDPDQYIIDFLESHPTFLEESRNKDEKTRERVERFERLNLGQ